MKKQFRLLAIALMALTVGCQKEGNSHSNPARLSIAGAQYIYENPAATRASSEELARFMSINEKGEHKPIRLIGENGDTLNMVIDKIKNLTEEYLIINGGFRFFDAAGSVMINSLLVNKKTEALYAINMNLSHGIDDSYVYEDESKNIYLAVEGSGMEDDMIYRFDVSNPNAVKISNSIPSNQGPNGVSEYIVNKRGLCYWKGNGEKIKTPGGRIYSLSDLLQGEDYSDHDIFKGLLNDNFYIITHFGGNQGSMLRCFEVTEKGANALELALVDEISFREYTWLTGDRGICNHIKKSYLFSVNDDRVIQYDESSRKLSLLDISVSRINVRYKYDITMYASNTVTSLSSAFIYDDKTNELDIIAFEDNNVKRISLANQYEIYSLCGNPYSDEATFSGLRYYDGKNVVGTIDKQGVISVVESVGNVNKETVLIRLN